MIDGVVDTCVQLEESERNYADIHKAWTDASAYYSRMEQDVQTAHENYIKEKNAFDMSLKESKETVQKLEESLEISISDADRLTRIVSNYEKELFKLKKEGSKMSELEKKVSELEHSLRESQEEGKERLAMCQAMEDEANKMIAHAEEALENIIREKEGLEEREKEIAAEKKACEDWAKELRAREKALDKETKTSSRTDKKGTVVVGVESPKRTSKRNKVTEEDTTMKKEKKEEEIRPTRSQAKKNAHANTKAQSLQPVEKNEKKNEKKKKTGSSRTKNTATKASLNKKSSSSRAATKKAPSVQKTTLTKKKKTTTTATKEDTASETASTRTRSGRTVKRKTFADEE